MTCQPRPASVAIPAVVAAGEVALEAAVGADQPAASAVAVEVVAAVGGATGPVATAL